MYQVFNIKKGCYYAILDLNWIAQHEKLEQKRDVEKKGKAFLVKKLLDNRNIIYDDNGKPHLEDQSVFVSFSHSHGKMVMIVNEYGHTGIDIEFIRDKVKKIQHKFLNQKELECAANHVEKLLVYWGAKEALYKVEGKKEVEFIKNIEIEDFEYHEKGIITGYILNDNLKKKYKLQYQKLEDYILVLVLEEIN